jgi:cellulose synthase/poly-beta-1,6-N-acetylglucosamine synthase-like glycosyltransferase
MDPLLLLTILFLAAFVCMGGIRLWSMYSMFADTSLAAIKRDWEYRPKVTVMISCFNEGQAVYETIKSVAASDYPSGLLEIMAFDDCSTDDSYSWMQKAAKEFPNVIVDKNIKNQGKAMTQTDMFARSSGDIVIGTDSDTIFDAGAISELVSCFADQQIGAVGGWCGIANVNDTVCSQVQAVQYIIAFFLIKEAENITRTVQCLGGPLVALRRHVYGSLIERIRNFKFLGAKITGGEDRYLTQSLLSDGHRTVINLNAKCWVNTPTEWRAYFNQQLRWRRSAFYNWMLSLSQIRHRIYKLGVVSMIQSLMPVTVCLATTVLLIYLAGIGLLLNFVLTLTIIHAATFPVYVWGVYNPLMRRRFPNQQVRDPIFTGIFLAIWSMVSFLVITPMALLTLDDGGWVTRS